MPNMIFIFDSAGFLQQFGAMFVLTECDHMFVNALHRKINLNEETKTYSTQKQDSSI